MKEMETPSSQTELEHQIVDLQNKIKGLKASLEDTSETTEIELLEKEIQRREETLNNLQGELKEGLRRSTRTKIPTPKALEMQQEEARKRERKFISTYERWKIRARESREQLKSDISKGELASLMDSLEKEKETVLNTYLEIRSHITPSPELRRHVDSCEAVTAEIMKVTYERMSDLDGDYDAEQVHCRLRELLKNSYARSIYGSTASRVTKTIRSHKSTTLTLKQADAAAELAAKEVEFEGLLEEERQMEKIEEQHRKMEVEKRRLERLQAEKNLRAARAKLQVYSQVASQEGSLHSSNSSVGNHHVPPAINPPTPTVTASPPDLNVSSLAQALQDSMALNRLPVPEPSVFSGDPIQFIEWKTSFMSLIDKKAISPADKLYYLRKYVGGPARKTLEGTFYRNDSDAYKDAWNKLDNRYGQTFIIQKAFRDKLTDWPKIQPRDAEGLRDFSDFLNACQDAMTHVKSLEILNDCEENKKLILKLPEWIASHWNRKVTEALKGNKEFPSFKDFAAFMATEAEIACNPITSAYALRSSESSTAKQGSRDPKRNKASVLNTQTEADTERLKPVKGKERSPCAFCQNNQHRLHGCPKFIAKTLEERRDFVREHKLCYGCTKPGHSAKDCRHRHSCNTCKGKHPTCLHDDNYLKKERVLPQETTILSNAGQTEAAATSMSVITGQPTNTSMIVPVWVSKKDTGTEKLVYALLDTQSDTTFVDQELSDVLKADSCPVKLKLTTMIGRDVIVKSQRVSGLCVRGYRSSLLIDLPPAYAKDCIPVNRAHIPTCETAKRWNHLSKVIEEIPPLQDCEVGLLIGYNCARAMAPRDVITGGDDEPYAIRTDLGWSIVGGTSTCPDTSSTAGQCFRVAVRELPPVTPADAIRILESDFKDAKEDGKPVSQEDILFLDKLKNHIEKNSLGHYEMPLPFKERPTLPDNKQLAVIRLSHLKRKLLKDEGYKEQYIKFMEEVIERGDAEEVHDDGKEGEKWYIPHHGVFHDKKPGKLRVVFDCSAKYKGTSLNDHLLTGPDLMNNLNGVLLRFRLHSTALMCDIEKMFHQFHVKKSDQDYLRFLWWKKGDLGAQPQEYRMRVHIFGAASSPGCANYGLKHLATENKDRYPLGSQFILRNFYVDDGVTSTDSSEKAIKLAEEARKLCALGGLRLHKFVSNDKAVLVSIPATERASDIKDLNLAFDNLPSERALGIQWHVESDCLKISTNLKEQPATRRGILSIVASLYDPLGLIAPFLLIGKEVLQQMCCHGTGWDDPLTNELRPRWEKWKNDLNNLERINIPRSYAPADFGRVIKRELHHFSDASTTGYGQCSYLRLSNEEGDIHCALVMAKSRVAPTKVTTIPRLELTAAVISVKTSNVLKEELGYADIEEHFWTDSKVVLGYINNEARRFHTFVANRIQKIHLYTNQRQWRYVPTDQNPADRASRGCFVHELISSDWFTGPAFLWEKGVDLSEEVAPELSVGDPEVKETRTLNTETVEQDSLTYRLAKFSSWTRAICAVARILRRINKDKSIGLSTVQEREEAERLIIKDLQRQTYSEEVRLLKKGCQLPPHNKLHHLNPFLDNNGVIKVGGRLRDSNLPLSVKHPTIIPKEHHVTRMIIAYCHEEVKHQGKGMTLSAIRTRGYWIPGIGRTVASYLRRCVVCRKLRRRTEEQKMADLPPERVNPSPPFTYCGMDCFGPFYSKQGRSVRKRYGLLFTCFSSRAIHIEMLEDLSTDSFIIGLRCFIAIRGAVRQIKSDQGSNFLGAKNELQEALTELDGDKLTNFLSKKQCDFILNAPGSSHVGGLWERQIRTVRSVLNATLGLSPGNLPDASLRAFFYEAMTIVNSRPLTIENLHDPNSLEPLTPNHLLTLKSTMALPPPGKFIREDMYARKRWRHVQYLAEQFWSRWQKEYLANIAFRQRWHTPKRNLQIGDIVIMKDEDLPRNEWRLGRVVETTMDRDGLVRRVKLCLGDRKLGKNGERLTKRSVLERPVQKLVLLLEGD
ncbi:uncharacterized protein LOC113016608 [Astatotilapia calliptera]|uniref:uncharacterized protein LOC113016608 n=1 Tax=Astatotilapia calliptera TaxID=8154 RepID=UPI000E40E537|nr:uncharacterized protein LOC113016608 [Astatotilapia calliptera]